MLFRYVGWEYIVGSILFLIGGVAYYYRLFKVKDHQQYEESDEILLWDENSYDWALDGSQGQTMNEPEYDLKP